MTDIERAYYQDRKDFYEKAIASLHNTLQLAEKNGLVALADEYRVTIEEYEQVLKFYTMKLED